MFHVDIYGLFIAFNKMADHHSNFDGLSSLISFAGVSIPARAKFVGQFIGASLFSSLTLGLVAGQTAATFLTCGPLIPFMTGSWIGYTWGCVGFWRLSKQKMVECARRYPGWFAVCLFKCYFFNDKLTSLFLYNSNH